MIYKRFDKVALKHSIYAPDPIDPDDKDDSGGHRHSGLNEDEKIAVGVSVSLVSLALIGFVVWWVYFRNKSASDSQFDKGPKFTEQIPNVPALEEMPQDTNMYTDPGDISLAPASKRQEFSIE